MPDQPSPHSVADQLPGVYQGEQVVENFCGALDEVVSPVVLTLDSLPAYLDPQTTPSDMLAWLGGWLGISVTAAAPVGEQRALIREGAEMLRWRGTAKGLRAAIRLEIGLDAEIVETGATEWSATAGMPFPGEEGNSVIVRITAAEPETVDVGLVEDIVAANVPAHVGHRIEIVASSTPAG